MMHDGPKCADCKKIIQPEENHMIVDQKTYCLKCHRDKKGFDKKKEGEHPGDGSKTPSKDGNQGIKKHKGGTPVAPYAAQAYKDH